MLEASNIGNITSPARPTGIGSSRPILHLPSRCMASQTSTERPSVAGFLSPQYRSYTADGDHTEQATMMVGVPNENARHLILWGPHGTDREAHGESASTGGAPEDWESSTFSTTPTTRDAG